MSLRKVDHRMISWTTFPWTTKP